jgi:hypothetical protein
MSTAEERRYASAPDFLTREESDKYEWHYSGDNYNYARRVAREKKGVLYTQVDAEDDVAYERGQHLVNRTGWYIVIDPKSKEE